MKRINLILMGLLLATAGYCQIPTKSKDGKNVLNLDKNGCMLQGFDVVAMFTQPDSTLKGNPAFVSEYQEAKYWFVSAANKSLFDANPSKYAPLYGGFCAVAVSEGNLRPIQVWTHSITEGHLVVNHNAKAKKLWLNHERRKFKIAQNNWTSVNLKDAKYDIIHDGETQESLSLTSFEGPKQ